MIYVQIAAYKDPELIPTIKDMLAKAHNPDDIKIGICLQDDPANFESIRQQVPNNTEIINVNWWESKGLCWARHLLQKLHTDEKYTMQLDSHHRFIPNWDKELIEMHEKFDNPRSILTAYAAPYNPDNGDLVDTTAYKMVAERFTEYGTIMFRPKKIDDYENLTAPVKARFVSGHFYFTIGEHCKEYLYDPNLYFAGDEISLSIRSYTLGYDLYHPHKNIVWHEYTRKNRTKHWDDHIPVNKTLIEQSWWERDVISKKRLRHLLKEEDNNIDLGEYGLGYIRTHHDYELYAGIDFNQKLLHDKTLKGIYPPTIEKTEANWEKEFCSMFNLNILIDSNIKNQCDDLDFCYIGVESSNGEVLYRKDIPSSEISSEHNASFYAIKKPYKYVIWPYSQSKKWLDRRDTIL